MAQHQARQSQISRRAVLRGAGGAAALAGLALTAGTTARSVRAEAGQHLEGSWINTLTPAGPGPSFRSLVTFHPDETYISSALPFAAAPPGLGVARVHVSASHGEWYRTGDRTFAATFMSLLADENGALIALQKVRTTYTLDEGGNSFSTQFQATYNGSDGALLTSFSGTGQASHIHVEPL